MLRDGVHTGDAKKSVALLAVRLEAPEKGRPMIQCHCYRLKAGTL